MTLDTRQPLIIANWKSHKSPTTAHAWVSRFLEWWTPLNQPGLEVVVAPAFPLLPAMASAVADTSLKLAAQDLSPFPPGAYTGAVSIDNLQGMPISAAILGHSERRRYFHETPVEIAQKVAQAVELGITPVVCVDEPDLDAQVAALDPTFLDNCIVAYEPLAAIGSGQPQSPATVSEMIEKIVQKFGEVPVIYGGSVSPETVTEYLAVCSGVLVGGASLDVDEFMTLVGAALP